MDPLHPQSMNRYAYAYNNPLRYNDPTGHAGDCVGGYDAKTGTCAPVPDSGLARFVWESATREVGGAVQRVKEWVSTPPDPNCVARQANQGAMAGAAFGLIGFATGIGEFATIPLFAATGGAVGAVAGVPACMAAANGGGGGGKTGRKRNPDRAASAEEQIKDLREEIDKLERGPNKTPEIKAQIKKLEAQLKRQIDRLRLSEEHARRGQR
jgi:hypothetical protein